MADHVPTSNNYRCLDTFASGILELLTYDGVSSSGSVVPSTEPDCLKMTSDDGTAAEVEIELPVGEKFTFSATFLTEALPADLESLDTTRFFIGAYNSGGKCIGIVLSEQGVALVDTPGTSAVPIPGTNIIQQCLGKTTRLTLIVDESGMANLLYEIEDVGSGVLFVAAAPGTPAGFGNGTLVEVLGTAEAPLEVDLDIVQCDCHRVVLPFALELPVAVPGPDRTSLLGEPIICDASQSYGYRDQPELVDENLGYEWSLVLAPDGSRFKIYDYNGTAVDDEDTDPFTNIFSALPGSSLFSLQNAPLLKPGDTLVLTRVVNGVSQNYAYTISSERWQLSATGWERDPAVWDDDEVVVEKDSIPVSWTSVAWAVYHTATFLHDRTSKLTYAIPDVSGLFELQLVVNTSWPTYSSPATVLVNVTATASALGVVPDVSYIWNYLTNFWDLLEDREKVSTIWSGFAQSAANLLLTAWQIDYNKSLKDIQRTFQRRWLPYSFLLPDQSASINIVRGPLVSMGTSTEPWAVVGKTLDLIIDGGPLIHIVFSGGASLTSLQVVEQINTALLAAGYLAMASVLVTASGQLLPQLVHTGLIQSVVSDPATSAAVVLGWVRAHPNTDLASTDYNVQNEVWGNGYIEAWDEKQLSPDPSVPPVQLGRYVGKLQYFDTGTRLAENLPEVAPVGTLVGFEVGSRRVYQGTTLIGEDFYGSPHGWRYFAALCTGYERTTGPTAYFMQTTYELPPFATGQWFLPSTVVSQSVDFQAAGVLRDDLAVFSVRDLSTGNAIDIHCAVLFAYGKKLAFDPRPLLIKWNGYPDNFETTFVGVLRTQEVPVDDLVVSIPRLQVEVADSTDALEEGKDYAVKKVVQNGAEVNAIVFRPGTFTPQDPPSAQYWAEQTHLDNSPAIEANFGHLVPPLSERSYVDWKKDFSNLDYLSAVQGLWYAYWGGPSVYRMRVGVQILLGLPFAEEAGTVVEVNDAFSAKEGRLLIQDKNGTIVRSYFYPHAVGPSSFKVGDTVERFAPLCGGVEILDWVNSPSWGKGFASSASVSSLQRYFKFVLRGNADAFDPLHILFAADFIKHIKPHYTDVVTVLQKAFTSNIDVEDVMTMKVGMKIVQSTDPLVRGALRWDDYDGAGRIRHHFDEDPIQFVWDHAGLSPRQQVTVLSSDDSVTTEELADLQAISGSSGDITIRALPGTGTLTRVVVLVRNPVRGPGADDYGTVDLSAGSGIATGVELSASEGDGTYVALDLGDLEVACSGQDFVATFHATGFTWSQATSGNIEFYFYIS